MKLHSQTQSQFETQMTSAVKAGRLSRILKESFWIVFGQAMAVCGSLAAVRVLTGMLDPVAYGELALGMSLSLIINHVIIGPLYSGVTRFYTAAVERHDFLGYIKAIQQLTLLSTFLIAFLALITGAVLVLANEMAWLTIALVAFLFAVIGGYNSILNGMQNAARQRFTVAFHQGAESWAKLVFAALLLYWLRETSTVAMIGYCVGSTLIVASQVLFFRKNFPREQSREGDSAYWRVKIRAYSWPFMAWGIFTGAHLLSDRWALQTFATVYEVGLYSVLYQLGNYPMTIATGLAMEFLAPILFQRSGDGRSSVRNADVNRLSWRLTFGALGVALLGFLLGLIFHRHLFQLFVNIKYHSVSYLLPWMLLSGGFYAAGQTITLNLMSQMKSRAMVEVKIFTALTGIILNFSGAYYFGLNGVVVAGLIFAVGYFFCMSMLALRVYRLSI